MTRVLLVGASTPIGRAVTARFQAAGGRVVGASLEPANDPGLVGDLTLDCSTPAGASDAVRAAVDTLGGLDVLVCATGQQPRGPVHTTTGDDWRRAFAGCLDTLFFTAREALPRLRSGSAIVAVSSVNAARPAPWLAAYAAAKGGLEALVRTLAVDYGASGIRVNAVAPGLVATAEAAAAGPDRTAGYPLGRMIRPTEVANAIFFLASAEASGITGTTLPVDGGLTTVSASTYGRPDLLERVRANLVGDA